MTKNVLDVKKDMVQGIPLGSPNGETGTERKDSRGVDEGMKDIRDEGSGGALGGVALGDGEAELEDSIFVVTIMQEQDTVPDYEEERGGKGG